MKRAFNAMSRKAMCLGLAVLLAAPLGVLPGCSASALLPPTGNDATVIDDERPPLESRTEEQEAALAEEERATDPDELGYVPGQIVVVYENDATEAEREEAVESLGAEETDKTAEFAVGDVASLTIDETKTVETAVREAEAEEAVKYAVPNYVAELFDDPTAEASGAIAGDSGSSKQWYLDFVKAPAAWELLADNVSAVKPVRVAVLDTGASLTHPDLKNRINKKDSAEVVWTDSNDASSWKTAPLRGDGYTNGGSVIDDFTSHGTHVSGIIAGEAGNGGILGVASGGTTVYANKLVDLVVVDAFSLMENGRPNASLMDLLFALGYVRDAGCSIVNMSLGIPTDNAEVAALFESICTELTKKNNMLIISAAGNSASTDTSYPAACTSVLGVISVSERRSVSTASRTFLNPAWGGDSEEVLRSYFSNYGDWCDISAPGEQIYSTYLAQGMQDGYINMQGTSMACPVVTAVAALVKAANPNLGPQEIRNILDQTATDLYQPGKDAQTGYGVVNAQAAVATALGVSAEAPMDAQTSPPSLQKADIEVKNGTYTGGTQEPQVTVRMDGRTLANGKDYVVRYGSVKPKNAGRYPITIEGRGDYTGIVNKEFVIQPADISRASVLVKDQVYTGSALEPVPTVQMGDARLQKDSDYTVAYRNNTEVGSATVVVKGKGNYTGTATGTFAIKNTSGTTSSAQQPMASVPSPDPTSDTVTETPVNKPTSPEEPGSSAPVAVTKKNLASVSVSGIASSYTYTGKAISPYPVLRSGGTVLCRGIDYTVAFSRNRALGTASVVMTGTGSYAGTIRMNFSIVAPKVKAVKIGALKAGTKAFSATWKCASGPVSSYQLQYSTSKKFTKATTKTLTVKAPKAKTLSKSVKKLKAKKTYYVRVRTVYQVGDETFVSSWSAVKKVKTKR